MLSKCCFFQSPSNSICIRDINKGKFVIKYKVQNVVMVCVCLYAVRLSQEITTEQAFSFAKEQGFVRCFETSVKDGTNINEALE